MTPPPREGAARDDVGARGSGSFGPNAWLVDDLYERYLEDPESVSEGWREFFSDYRRPARTAAPEPPPPPTPARAAAAPSPPAARGEPLRGAARRVAQNMETSLSVPTATSVRTIPARLLEINRAALNEYLSRTSSTKISFTHLICFAILRGLAEVPALNASYVEAVDDKGTPGVDRHDHVGLGLAVDVVRDDGSRSLVVPVVRDADTLGFAEFVHAYEDLVRKVHAGQAVPDDFFGATVSVTNPGTLGTSMSVPRLMAGQGAIIGVGAIGWPSGLDAADPRALSQLGVGKVLTLTSTYDHRIIQGAESGAFLRHVDQCLHGQHGFYDAIFEDLGVPVEPARWSQDTNAASAAGLDESLKVVRVHKLINMYRVRGHLNANLNPLETAPPVLHPELDLAHYGLTIWDLDREFATDGLAGRASATLQEILAILRAAYCGTLAIEYMHIQDPDQKLWIQERVEGVVTTPSVEEQRHLLERLNAAEVFERFLHTRYVGQKRFGLEGAESTIVALDALFDAAAQRGVADAVLGMAHRGRLNVLANIVGKGYGEIFSEFEGNLDPQSVQGSGDVKYHKGATGVFKGHSGATLRLTMVSNPSHLEAVDPVVEGVARAKQDRVIAPSTGESPDARLPSHPVLAVLIHGDAAFAGQGVVAETLNLSGLSGYRTGGSVHLVINNQVGFTTPPENARTSFYATDVAKMIQAPIFHVNGDDPEACARAMRLAFDFREEFSTDVVVDLVCYRRHGHNEGDDPSYTQPLMYRAIDAKRSVRKLYTEALIRRGDLTLEEAEGALADFQEKLQSVLDEVRGRPAPTLTAVLPVTVPEDPDAPPTGVDAATLRRVAARTTSVPDGFVLHPKLARQFAARDELVASGEVDWSLAEALAIGTLLLEGTDVRLVGQDTRRGTFSQRHAALIDYEDGTQFVPLCHLEGATGRFTARDSLLSEYAALGFEYGYSVERPDALVAWEAQFGDFVNGAEIIVDNFLVAAEDKWGQLASVVLLLPHGYEGQGPEHSSGRIERFLSLSARNNLRIAVPSTAAQYFHLLRAQVRRGHPTPLVCFTPKSLLRAAATRSTLASLERGAFATVLDDTSVATPDAVGTVVLASGKVAHEARTHRDALVAAGSLGPDSVAIVRVEQVYPWPDDTVASVLARYASARDVCWLQEEPENMGPWPFVHHQLHRDLRDSHTLRHVARVESASPATGSAIVFEAEQEDLFTRVFG
ncbi:MAG TPA: multifunctional oxoglutarate decarboxylase/oxoglutarate dehydrogenase thiamine pyrophosphate-binding subunit/dihydrolipoyllysine-residue succinyltransferase subunit [Acidimicrobiales bacterium]|jgi:2-oxoglutarate dehydrogenase E1 component|nr:multifunctional oxoglutarate decarboxylase/oxoglutarate dehydrogenase thiamine pyrophosphate-binding subunit/dihydrolipoyllysine-residue succinyltransferase subunit [Acidimicrobiales bacterium]